MMWDNIVKELERYRNRTFFVGCSGGIDSMVLSHFLYVNNFRLHLLHVNYQKRGEQSDADMEFVRLFCRERNIPFDVCFFPKSISGNFQQEARLFRYRFFEQKARPTKGLIALGHHADDNIETFFIHLARKSGILGLASIPRQRGDYIRPFLTLSKADLIAYAQKHDLSWREDSSNRSVVYWRNRWRIEFIPLMEQHVPTIKESVLTLIDAFVSTQKELEQKMQPIAEKIRQEKIVLDEQYVQFSPEELFELWRQLKLDKKLFPRFIELPTYSIGKYIEVNTPWERIIRKNKHFLFVAKASNPSIPKIKQSLRIALPKMFNKNILYLNPKRIKGNLFLRYWQAGDRISPLGMPGSQPISKIIKDAKIPEQERSRVLVLCDQEMIHWIVGLKVGRYATSKKEDAVYLKIELLDK